MPKNSNRNRNTGKHNAFKANIIAKGKMVKLRGRIYFYMRVGGDMHNIGGISIVRAT